MVCCKYVILLLFLASLYEEFVEHGINECVQNKTTLKCAKNYGNWLRHFEPISRCELSNVVAYFLPSL